MSPADQAEDFKIGAYTIKTNNDLIGRSPTAFRASVGRLKETTPNAPVHRGSPRDRSKTPAIQHAIAWSTGPRRQSPQ